MIRQACSLHGPTGLRDLGRMFCLYDDVSLYRYMYWMAKTAVANAVITGRLPWQPAGIKFTQCVSGQKISIFAPAGKTVLWIEK